MIKVIKKGKDYFQAPGNHFWQWAENTDVIEWRSGNTICYRDDLIDILKELGEDEVPAMAPLLLVLSACQRELQAHEQFFLQQQLTGGENNSVDSSYEPALKLLQIISELPPDLRTGRKRINLIREIFTDTGFILVSADFKILLNELYSGRLDLIIRRNANDNDRSGFIDEMRSLGMALARFPDKESLELKLKTGLNKLPVANDITVSDAVFTDLLDQLLQDPQTAGISKLARRLVAVIHIPMHSHGSGDQPYGGISDITNRGSYDRLLLSELAHDDLLLMARLVNNEALYFRREEPPEKPKRRRIILMDVTIKMWGLPRVFALSAALAFARNSKHGEQVDVYLLEGDQYREVSLEDKAGVIRALELLHHSLDCGKALEAAIRELPVSNENEYVLITDERQMNIPGFHSSFSNVREQLSFLITVSRNGDFRFYEFVKGRARLLNEAKLDLDDLFVAPPTRVQRHIPIDEFPAFMSCRPLPLLLAKKGINALENNAFLKSKVGLLVITKNQQVFWLTGSNKGAYELLPFIERGTYTFGWDNLTSFYILVFNVQKKWLKFYRFNTASFEVVQHDLTFDIPNFEKAAFSEESLLYISTESATYIYDCEKGNIKEKVDRNVFVNKAQAFLNKTTLSDARAVRPYLNVGSFDFVYKIDQLYISDDGVIVAGKHYLGFKHNGQHLAFLSNSDKKIATGTSNERTMNFPGTHIKYNRRFWPDGSMAVIEKRGLLHLKSSDTSLAEVTIVLAIGPSATTAGWASDGKACGNNFFIHEGHVDVIPSQLFYQKYIQPFIDRLVNYATATKI